MLVRLRRSVTGVAAEGSGLVTMPSGSVLEVPDPALGTGLIRVFWNGSAVFVSIEDVVGRMDRIQAQAWQVGTERRPR